MSWEINEDGDVIVDGVKVYVTLHPGRLDAMVRTPDEATFWEQAQAVELVETDELSGMLVPRKGITITTIGQLYGTPEDTDSPAPVIDSRFHANFWLNERWIRLGEWANWAWAWSVLGSPVVPNKSEAAVEYHTIELIDPKTVVTPKNILL